MLHSCTCAHLTNSLQILPNHHGSVGSEWNKLKGIVPELSAKSGCVVHYTNHSLRATAMTRMFNKGVPEKVIAERSGHRSLQAMRNYEHPSVELERAAGEVIIVRLVRRGSLI